jgi:UDP-N-acetylglucosamine 2-epimerase (non-hydrolysing)
MELNKYPILICFGTRPEWLKLKPIINLLPKSYYKLLFTGQHSDLLTNITVDYNINLTENGNRLDSILIECMKQFPDDNFSGVLIQGDTASTFGCAIAAFNRSLKIYYIESGLRTYNLNHPYPEEGYRQMISRLSDVNFCPTELSKENLLQERVKGECYVVGNTILDNLVNHINDIHYDNTILITLHRRENHTIIDKWFCEFEKLAVSYPHYKFILPIHPNPNVIKHIGLLNNVNIVNPLTHCDIIQHLKKCLLIITDSGGLQEEGSFFNKKVIVCRRITERPEGIKSGHLYMCDNPYNLKYIFDNIHTNPHIDTKCPYGDGHTSSRIIKYLVNDIVE